MSEERCGVRLQARDRFESFHPRHCENPATEEVNGKRFCKRHATVERKRQERFDAEKRERQLDANTREEVAELAEKHGIEAQVAFRFGKYDRERVTIRLATLRQLLETAPSSHPPPRKERIDPVPRRPEDGRMD